MPDSNASFLVLIVEDDSDDRLMLDEAFDSFTKDHNVHFEFYDDIDQLMDYLEQCKPDTECPRTWPGLIIMDIKLPKLDGLEILKKLKDDQFLKLIPVIIMSGSPSNRHLETSYELGASGFIKKPAYFNEFSDVIGDIIDYWKYASRVPTRPDN